MARGVHGNPRGDGVATFGPDVTERFCERENLDLIIRSHQYVPEGYKIMHSGHLITLFSARDYLEQSRYLALQSHNISTTVPFWVEQTITFKTSFTFKLTARCCTISRQPVSLAQRNNAAMLLAAQDERCVDLHLDSELFKLYCHS